jgi:short-subunit dehydrogenase
MKTVIITGSTSGIGEACVKIFLKNSWKVIATGRNIEKLEKLKGLGADIFKLDVTKQVDINNLITHIVNSNIKVDVLVNNAGYGQFGTIEEITDEQARAQFDTNVFGLAAMTRAIIPHMRDNGGGRIVNISSLAGLTSLPGGGWYAASKFAVEALSDALRWETKQFGIKVSLIEPGPIQTGFAEVVNTNITVAETSPYGSLISDLTQSTKGIKGGTAEGCARKVYRAASSRFPRNRYLVTGLAVIVKILLYILPPKLMDFFIIRMFIPALKVNCKTKRKKK